MGPREPVPAPDAGFSLDQRLLEQSALFEMCHTITSSLSLGAIVENMLRIPMGHFLISRGIVLLRDPKESEFRVEGLRGISRDIFHKTLRLTDPPGHSVLMRDHAGDEEWAVFFRGFGIEIVLPLPTSRGVLGLLGFGERIGGKAFGEREVEFLDSLSGIAATAVANGLLVEEIRSVNQLLDRKVQQLHTIFDIGRELNVTLDMEKIGHILTFAIMGELMVNRCIVMAEEGEGIRILVSKGAVAPPPADPAWLRLSKPETPAGDGFFPEWKQAGIAVLVPMRIHDETRGLLALGPKLSGEPFSESDLEFLSTLGHQAMSSIENVLLVREALDKERMEEELRFARGIQQDLLPKSMPPMKGFDIAAVNVPSREIGGDYYDVLQLDETHVGFAIADVSGKGAGAALLMASLQASLRALAGTGLPIRDLVFRINNLIHRNTALDKFITFFYGVLDTEARCFVFCNAGHNPPLRMSAGGGATPLEKGGVILGMMANVSYETGEVSLDPGDRLLFYTDGISEAVNGKGEEFGTDRITALLRSGADGSASGLIEAMMDAVVRFREEAEQNDDMTLMAVKIE
jgi:sigma-B regulation protein RsbU (phosphoserine phosphatase)